MKKTKIGNPLKGVREAFAPYAFLLGALALVLVAGFIYWKAQGPLHSPRDFERRTEPVMAKFDLKKGPSTSQKKIVSGKRYTHTEEAYTAPAKFEWRAFERDLKRQLARTPYAVAKMRRTQAVSSETYRATVNYGPCDIVTLQVTKPRPKAIPLPPVKPVKGRARVAIVIDDFGYTMANIERLFDIGEPVTMAILPNLAYSREVARMAAVHGYETMLHLPLEAKSAAAREEPHTIQVTMTDAQAVECLGRQLAAVPGVKGVSNHQGSKATEDRRLMKAIIGSLKKRGLYFFDSLTSQESVAAEVARSAGVPSARRDLFLDNSSKTADIERELDHLAAVAFKQGAVIAVCHDRKNTIAALAAAMPRMAEDGIEFVSLSELIR